MFGYLQWLCHAVPTEKALREKLSEYFTLRGFDMLFELPIKVSLDKPM
jgi:hypothetical protein